VNVSLGADGGPLGSPHARRPPATRRAGAREALNGNSRTSRALLTLGWSSACRRPEAAPRECHGVGAILGRAEHVGLLAAAGDAVTLQVGDMRGERRRSEGAAPMADHPSLDDDAALGGEEPAAAEHSPAALERQSAVPWGPPAPEGP
jgi:hypothetical protein